MPTTLSAAFHTTQKFRLRTGMSLLTEITTQREPTERGGRWIWAEAAYEVEVRIGSEETTITTSGFPTGDLMMICPSHRDAVAPLDYVALWRTIDAMCGTATSRMTDDPACTRIAALVPLLIEWSHTPSDAQGRSTGMRIDVDLPSPWHPCRATLATNVHCLDGAPTFVAPRPIPLSGSRHLEEAREMPPVFVHLIEASSECFLHVDAGFPVGKDGFRGDVLRAGQATLSVHSMDADEIEHDPMETLRWFRQANQTEGRSLTG